MSTLPYRSFYEYLKSKGLLNASKSAVISARKEWKKIYNSAYWKNYKKEQISIVLDIGDKKYLENKAIENKTKITTYILHLIKQDKDGISTRPNLLIDIEVGLLQTLDSLSKKMNNSSQSKVHVTETYHQIEALLTLLNL